MHRSTPAGSQTILRSVDVLQCIVEGEKPERVDQNDTATLLRFLRVFADEHRHMKEESVLFPELMRTSQTEAGPVRHLLFEHTQERSLVEGLEDALRRTKTAEFAVFANRPTERVRNHIQKEEVTFRAGFRLTALMFLFRRGLRMLQMIERERVSRGA